MELTFGPSITEQDVMITIIDDNRLEPDEQFNSTVFLTVTDPSVDLNPADAGITIIDDDSKQKLEVRGENGTMQQNRDMPTIMKL